MLVLRGTCALSWVRSPTVDVPQPLVRIKIKVMATIFGVATDFRSCPSMTSGVDLGTEMEEWVG